MIEKGRKVSDNPEAWDLGTLIIIFTEYKETIFQPDFGDSIQRVLPVLYAVKDMRNRRVHEISRKFPIYAREAYALSDQVARFFEMMTCDVPKEFHEETRRFRLTAL